LGVAWLDRSAGHITHGLYLDGIMIRLRTWYHEMAGIRRFGHITQYLNGIDGYK
jgi:hypothetical protein